MRTSLAMNATCKGLALYLVSAVILSGSPVLADSISPNINNGDRDYSTEKPNSSYYGTGYTGRMTEASELRFEADQLLADGKLEEAKKKLGKAVMLDPGAPEGHMMYARCITRILHSKKTIDEDLLARCIEEWSLIWHHDADQVEQAEAKAQARSLIRIARMLEKEKKEKEKEETLAQQADQDDDQGAPSEQKKSHKKERALASAHKKAVD